LSENESMNNLKDRAQARKPSIARIILDTRMQVCEAFVSGGPDAALAALAAQSIRLSRYVVAGELLPRQVFRALLQVACNLRLAQHCGKPAVWAALSAGPRLYDELDGRAA